MSLTSDEPKLEAFVRGIGFREADLPVERVTGIGPGTFAVMRRAP